MPCGFLNSTLFSKLKIARNHSGSRCPACMVASNTISKRMGRNPFSYPGAGVASSKGPANSTISRLKGLFWLSRVSCDSEAGDYPRSGFRIPAATKALVGNRKIPGCSTETTPIFNAKEWAIPHRTNFLEQFGVEPPAAPIDPRPFGDPCKDKNANDCPISTAERVQEQDCDIN